MNKWSVGWGTIKDCNMKCKFCYSKEVRTEQIDALGLDIWIRFIDNNHKYIEAINYGTGENSISDDWFENTASNHNKRVFVRKDNKF